MDRDNRRTRMALRKASGAAVASTDPRRVLAVRPRLWSAAASSGRMVAPGAGKSTITAATLEDARPCMPASGVALTTPRRAQAAGLDPRGRLAPHDSHRRFAA